MTPHACMAMAVVLAAACAAAPAQGSGPLPFNHDIGRVPLPRR